ncbi:MAG TPA: T9SS type A sorting domain-containing protein, partial [Bacteroidota bacterium]
SSTDGGTVWAVNPVSSNVPLNDRQWIATHGENEVYLTFKQLGVLLVGTESIFVLKSFDGGLTFPQVVEATTPEFGVQPGDQGNIAVDRNNGNVYTVFIGSAGNSVYMARSTNGGQSFAILLAHAGPSGVSYANVFPIVAVDRGSNVHVVYSDGASIFLTSSQDQGNTWNLPVRVSNGADTKTSLSPWIDAGDAGSVDISWWGTSSSNNLAPDAQWKVLFAQTQNALARSPSISQSEATGVFHTGPICVDGTGCASGTRDLAEYASTTIYNDGTAMIVYPDNQHQTNPLTYFVKQSGGNTVLSKSVTNAVDRMETDVAGSVPRRFALEQNYPNPFNPSTAIRYSIPEAGQVRLSVYNVLGQEIAVLVNDQQSPGSYQVQFDASRFSSGMYFYRLTAGVSHQMTRRMIILK